MRELFLCLLILVFIYGCSHKLQALVTISSEKEEQARFVQAQNNKLELLLKDIKTDNLKKGLTKQQVVHYYGEPVLVKKENSRDVFLYRDMVEFFPKEKIYLYFDSDNKLTDFILEEKAAKPTEEKTNPVTAEKPS